MFGATIFVPLVTGLDPAVALFTSAAGTLIFHLITGGQVPAYLGSSFAFIAPLQTAIGDDRYGGMSGALGGVMVAGFIYVILSAIIQRIGTGFMHKYLPAVVVGPVIMTIGLGLAGVAKDFSEQHYVVAFFTLAVVIVVSVFAKGLFKVIPILTGIISGYLFAVLLETLGYAEGLIDLSSVHAATWQPALPAFVLPSFNISAIFLIAPIAIVTVVEHLGDILAIGRTVGQDFIEEPGLHRTMLGDGIATAVAGLLGGPPNTTYGENIGVLALTKVYNPIVIEGAALLVILLSLFPKVGAFIGTVPMAVMGGIMILIFGMIASVGLRTVIEKQVDLSATRNLIIVSAILVLGISGITIFGIAGMGLGAIGGILLNIVLPEDVLEQ